MKSLFKYASIVVIVFVVSVLLLPTSKAQKNQSNQLSADKFQDQSLDEISVQVNQPNQIESGKTNVLVELTDIPLTKVYAAIMAKPGLLEGKKAEASRATKSQFALIKDRQARIAGELKSARFQAREIYRVQRALNGIAIEVDSDKIEEIRSLPGVQSVTPIELEYPTNSTSVPFLGTPTVWGSSLNIGPGGLGVKGENMKIGVIDTGIDYQHATFGGTGALADYQANNRTVAPDAYFPTAKVVGGTDFAGDAYTGSNAPVPDPDPMDCNGHGTHVSGTAAGFGVNADGTTYTGAFNETVNYNPLRVGPGTAPKASLYALRVFGCTGGTNLTVQAIDWATDPNDDNDLSDHLDVINMSLGSNYGVLANTSAQASDNAVLAGVIVVTSAGNAGDTYFIGGAPGSGTRVLATAASADNAAASFVRMTISGNPTFFTTGIAFFGPTVPSAGVTGNAVLALDPADAAGPLTTDGCSPLTNAAAIAGNIAVIDRGTCGFTVKVKNAQNAGAIGVIIANSSAGAFGNMSGTDATITIPSVMVTFADGNTIKTNIGSPATILPGGDTLAGFSSRGARGGGFSTLQLKPDIAAPGLNITSAQTGVTCTTGACQTPNATGFIAGSQSLLLSGTSMASPHMAGIMALLKQLHPDWTVEQLKALAMNGAIHDITTLPAGNGIRYGLGRIGAGRVDPVNSALLPVTAYNAEEAGTVSLTFNSEISGVQTQTKKIRVVNSGATPQTFDLALDNLVDAPGVSFSLPGGSSVTVPANQAIELDVLMSADASQMDHTRDATVAATQAAPAPINALGNLARHWLTEEASYVTFKQGGNLKMRVPLYAAPRAVSNMSAPATITTGGAPTGSTTIPLSGTDVCTGTLGAGPTCTGTFPTDEASLVTPFELQVVSPRNTSIPGSADLQYGGVAYSPSSNLLMFGVSTWEKWSTPTETTFNIFIDTNQDGTYDRILFNTNPGTLSTLLGNTTATGQDSFITATLNLSTNGVSTSQFVNGLSSAGADTALFNNNVMFLAATPAQLGLTAGDTDFRYKIVTCPGFAPLCGTGTGFYDNAAGPYFWNSNFQGLNFGNGGSLFFDLNGAALPVTWNTANMTTNGSLGGLLLHHHNGSGKQAEVILLQGSQSADLGLSYSFSPVNPAQGQNVTLTITVNNAGPNAATGVVVTDPLPAGLTYVSDDGAAAYNNATGQWTVGNLANGASTTLHIVATVNTTDQIQTTAQITSGTPLDPNPANNQSTLLLMSPRQSDLALAMSVSSPTVMAGSSVTYTLTVKNNGSDPAYSLNVNENFPSFPALNPTSFTVSQGTYNPSTGVWNLASLGSGFTATLTATFTAPNTPGPLTLQGSVGATTSDPNTANNSASATTNVVTPPAVTGTKTVSGTFSPGGTVTYTVTLSNSGTIAQPDNPGNEFTDVLPAGLTLVSSASSSGTAVASVGTNTVTWNGSIPGSGSVTITITATINAGTGGQTISNQGTINYDGDNNGTNESTAVTNDPGTAAANDPTSFTVQNVADLSVTKTASPNPVIAGNNIAYSINVTNGGPNAALTATLTDNIPANTTFQSITAPAGWACTTPAVNAAGTVTCTNASLANGTVASFVLVVNVNTGVANGTVISNTASVSTTSQDTNPANNTATATATVAEYTSPAPTGLPTKALLVKPTTGNTTAGGGASDSSCVAPTGVTVAGVFANINQALGAAGVGDTIYVCPKYSANLVVPYVEHVSLGFTNLSVVGISDAKGSRAVIAANPSTATTPTTQLGTNYIVQIVATGVNFGNFVVDGAPGGVNYANTGIFNGIVVRRSGAFVFNNTVQNIRTTDAAVNANGQGIAVFGAGSAGSPLEGGTLASPVNILNNVVQTYRSNGVNVSAGSSSSYAFVRGNYIIGNGANSGTVNQTGVQFQSGANGDVFNNRITRILDNVAGCSPAAFSNCSAGIRLNTTASSSANNLRVRFNLISNTQTGIFAQDVQYVSMTSNTISNSVIDGINLRGSLFTLGSNFSTINQNTILSARRAGVFIGLIGGDASLGNNLTQNTIEDAFTGVANTPPAGNNTIPTTGATANTFISVNNFIGSATSGVNDVQNTNPLP